MTNEPHDPAVQRFRDLVSGAECLPASIDSYRKIHQLALVSSLSGRVPIYLDTKFWVELRRAEERMAQGDAQELLSAIRKAVTAGMAFCPISASAFMELLQHSEPEARIQTARLVDELSLGVSLISMDELLEAELEWHLTQATDSPVDPETVPIWTKLCYALGSVTPHINKFPPNVMLAFQVATLDSLWPMTLEEIARGLEPNRVDRAEAAATITHDSRAHSKEASDFKTAYAAEAWGIARFAAPICASVARRIQPKSEIKARGFSEGNGAKFIASSLIENTARQALRSMHTRAAWHAIFRLNHARAFKANDFLDIEHAASAVGYCKAFFTERSLATALTQPPVGLDRLYGCFITSSLSEAKQYVRSLNRN